MKRTLLPLLAAALCGLSAVVCVDDQLRDPGPVGTAECPARAVAGPGCGVRGGVVGGLRGGPAPFSPAEGPGHRKETALTDRKEAAPDGAASFRYLWI